ncbi:MAG: potassium channel family protein [Flavobacteriaceae bacterium]
MIKNIREKLQPFRYAILLVSSMLILFSVSIPNDSWGFKFFYAGFYLFNILAGILVVDQYQNFRSKFIRLVGLFLSLIIIVNLIANIPFFESIIGLLFVIFILSISIRVYKDIYAAKRVSSEIIAAVFCGYIYLGFITTFLFMAIEGLAPGSFNGIDETMNRFDNMLYFSFVSLLTIGYGDMTPNTSLTKSLVISIGLVGNFYSVIVTAIIVGKFLLNYRSDAFEND